MTNIRDGFKPVSLLAVILLIGTAVSGCDDTKGKQPQMQLSAFAASGLTISNSGGAKITLKNRTITVKNEITGKVIDELDAVRLCGHTPEFQDGTAIDTMKGGQEVKHAWITPPPLGSVLAITIQESPSGNSISAKVPVR